MNRDDPARRCVCPGSYDPVTVGHLDVILRARELFDEVIVAVMVNPAKRTLFSPEERVTFVQEAVEGAPGVRVEIVEGMLLTDYAQSVGALAVVKGLRSGADLAYERPMALMNRALSALETVLLLGDPRHEHISSSLVKEVCGLGGDVSTMVPPIVLDALRRAVGPTPA